jgi:hypothetical protein
MKSIIVWIIIVIGEFSGIYLIYAGHKRKINNGPQFKLEHIFQNIPLNEQSGIQLIIEGISVTLSGILLYWAYFMW